MSADHYRKLTRDLEELKESAQVVLNYAQEAEYYAAGRNFPLVAHQLNRLRDELNATRDALGHVDLDIHAIHKEARK